MFVVITAVSKKDIRWLQCEPALYDKMTVNGFEMFSWKLRITFKIKFVLLVKINIYFCFWVLDSCIWFFLKDHILNFIPRCQISTFEQCQEWLKRLNTAVRPPSRLEDLFAFAFHAWCMEVYAGEKEQHGELCRPGTLLIARLSLQKLTQTCFLLIGHLCCHCRWTCDLMVQEWGGADGLWHSKCLEDIWYQQQVQVDAAFFQDTAPVLISELQLEDGFHPLLSLANSTSQYVLNSGWLCYCTPWVLNPGQIRGWPRIRCLQTETFVEPSQSFGVPSPCLTLLFVPFCTARLCPSYPQQLLVPAWITDKELENVAAFRSWKRFPAVVYRFVFISSAAIKSRHLACLSLER